MTVATKYGCCVPQHAQLRCRLRWAKLSVRTRPECVGTISLVLEFSGSLATGADHHQGSREASCDSAGRIPCCALKMRIGRCSLRSPLQAIAARKHSVCASFGIARSHYNRQVEELLRGARGFARRIDLQNQAAGACMCLCLVHPCPVLCRNPDPRHKMAQNGRLQSLS